MNITSLVLTQFMTLLSLVTASGVLLHDTNLDKAFSTVIHGSTNSSEMNTETKANLRSGSQPHTHAKHLAVGRDQPDNAKMPPRNRDRKRSVVKRVGQGYHGNGYCMPLAGEWV